MKKLIVIGLLVCGLFGLTSAYGVCPPQWSPGPNSGCPNCSCDPVTLEQMGSFDASGNWVFNSGFHQELSSWLSSTGMPTMNDNDWTPKVFLNWAPNTNFGLPHLQVQYKEVGVATRIYMQLPGIWLGRPEIYRWTYNGNFNAFIVNWAPPPGCVNPGQCSGPPNNNDPNPCCWLWDKPKMIQNSPLEIVQFSDIESIQWYQNGVMKGSLTQADAPGAFRLVNSENQINKKSDDFISGRRHAYHSQTVTCHQQQSSADHDGHRDNPCQKLAVNDAISVDRLRKDAAHRTAGAFAVDSVKPQCYPHDRYYQADGKS